MAKEKISVVVTDLDNTLYDWVAPWFARYTTLIDLLEQRAQIPRDTLLTEIRHAHQISHTSEPPDILSKVPCVVSARKRGITQDTLNSCATEADKAGIRALALYPGVKDVLSRFKADNVLVVGFTESQAYSTRFRLQALGLDGLLPLVFSRRDHGLSEDYHRVMFPLYQTHHRVLPPTFAGKPDPGTLRKIVEGTGVVPEKCVYVGDSILKYICMAQAVGVHDVHAKYGEAHNRPAYEFLRTLSHWTSEDIIKEQRVAPTCLAAPRVSLSTSFDQLFDHFQFEPHFRQRTPPRSPESVYSDVGR